MYRISISTLSSLAFISIFLISNIACSQDKRATESESSTTKPERETFTIVEAQPSYKGGFDAFYKYLITDIKYPVEARNAGTEGIVKVKFDIERNGSVSNVSAMEGLGFGCDKEAIRVITNAPGFKAGSQRCRTIKTTIIIPITFKLDKEKRNPDNSAQGIVVAGELTVLPSELIVTADYKNGAWAGTVTNSDGKKLPGVNIVLAGTKYGTVSDLSGALSIKAEAEQELHISCVGYESVIIN